MKILISTIRFIFLSQENTLSQTAKDGVAVYGKNLHSCRRRHSLHAHALKSH